METIISICIASAALIITLYEVHATRRHNRLSVLPKLTFYGDEETDEFIFQLRLKNEGLGPAIITDFEITLDGETIEGGASPTSWNIFLNKLNIKKPSHIKTSFGPNTILGSGGCINVLCFDYMKNKNDKIFLDNFKRRLSNIKFVCEYKSMYGCKDITDFDGSYFYKADQNIKRT